MSDYAGLDVFHETITVLPDNAKPSAMDFALAVEGLTDRTTYLANRGSRGYYAQVTALTSGTPGVIYGASGGSGAFVEFAASNGLVPYLDVLDCQVGDIVSARASGAFFQTSNADGGDLAGYAEIKLYQTQNFGVSPTPAAAITGAHAIVDASQTGVPASGDICSPQHLTIEGALIIGTAGTCRIRLRGRNPQALGNVGVRRKTSPATQYPLSLVAYVWRPTSTWGGA